MRLDDSYRLLDLSPTASDEEVKQAHRDLMKVWHPDRFGRDPALRLKAEEKLKAINEAYEAIIVSRSYGSGGTSGSSTYGSNGTYGSSGAGYRYEEASRTPA